MELCVTGATGPVILPGIAVKAVLSTVQRSAAVAEEAAVAAVIVKQIVTSVIAVAISPGIARTRIDVTGNIHCAWYSESLDPIRSIETTFSSSLLTRSFCAITLLF